MSDDDYPYKAKERIEALISSMETVIKRDPEQEVQGMALPVIDAALVDVKQAMPDDPVVQSLVDLVSADWIGSGDTIRAADMLHVAKQLDAAIDDRPIAFA